MDDLRMSPGTLYLCATPIGNLEDITLRALRILKTVDYIAAEDTRHTLKLLNHYEIVKPMISYHEHNKKRRGPEILSMLREGCSVALVSDAGMPGISDPGADLVALLHKEGMMPVIIPGPSAALSALVLSGLPAGRFAFEGFLPREPKELRKRLLALASETRTIIIYEAPHRIKALLPELLKYLGNRRAAVARELTKVHEQVLTADLANACSYYEDLTPRGEFVLVLEGASPSGELFDFEGLSIREHLQAYMEAGLEKREAVKLVAKDRGLPKNEVYKHTLG